MVAAHPFSCFELLGLDLLIDEDLKPWLLEVNHSPSLACDTALDRDLKQALLEDVMQLCSFSKAEAGLLRKTAKESSTATVRPKVAPTAANRPTNRPTNSLGSRRDGSLSEGLAALRARIGSNAIGGRPVPSLVPRSTLGGSGGASAATRLSAGFGRRSSALEARVPEGNVWPRPPWAQRASPPPPPA